MSLGDITQSLIAAVSMVGTVSVIFYGGAISTSKARNDLIRELQAGDFGVYRFSTIANWWAGYFYVLFGKNTLAKRQLVTIPLYTLVVSWVFFGIWIAYVYIFHNPKHVLAPLPLEMKQAIEAFYTEGVFAALLIDVICIQATKRAIAKGDQFGFGSFKFYRAFLSPFIFGTIGFIFATHVFRVADMVFVYGVFAPHDAMPLMPFEPLTRLKHGLRLFQPETVAHITSRGAYTTYFMPEPLILYCAIAAQLSIVIIAFAYWTSIFLARTKVFSIFFLKQIGNKKAQARAFFAMMVANVVLIPLLLVLFLTSFK